MRMENISTKLTKMFRYQHDTYAIIYSLGYDAREKLCRKRVFKCKINA